MTIQEKCEQYWNTSNIGDEEIHAALGWIEQQANTLTKHIESLENADIETGKRIAELEEELKWKERKGLDGDGKAYLTHRMEQDAKIMELEAYKVDAEKAFAKYWALEAENERLREEVSLSKSQS
jgi:hypothetical protein